MVLAALALSALAAPPLELRPSPRTLSQPVIRGAGGRYDAHATVGPDDLPLVRGSDGHYLVFDVSVEVGRELISLPTMGKRGSRIQYRIGAPSYTLWIHSDFSSDAVLVGPIGAPLSSLEPVSQLGVQLGDLVHQGDSYPHRIAVRVDDASTFGESRFPLRYDLVQAHREFPTHKAVSRPKFPRR